MLNKSKKLKVVWICHFSNDHIQDILKPRKRINNFAPWITFGIESAKKRNDLELHIVSPHRWINSDKEFVEGNIHYHFFNPGIPIIGRHWPDSFRFDIYTNFYHNRKKIKQFVKKINPDIVNLHGLENAYYSVSFFDVIKLNFPVLITIQGFNHLQIPKGKLNLNFKTRLAIEEKILSEGRYFGIMTNYVGNIIKKYNNQARLYRHELFINDSLHYSIDNNITKGYDIVFFARVTKFKGIEDLIQAFCILKKQIPALNMAVIGVYDKQYLQYLISLIKKENRDSVFFLGHLPQNKIYNILRKSKLVVLPTYNDNMPGTIIESMLNKIAVLSYKTGGITEINKEDKYIELVDVGDIKNLSARISHLLFNERYRNNLKEKAYNYAKSRWNNDKSMNDLTDAYLKILKDTESHYIIKQES